MASRQGSGSSFLQRVIIVLSVAVVLFCTVLHAKDLTVGDSEGWKLNVDYEQWAKNNPVNVGDVLVFTYPVGVHNVFAVNGTAYRNCYKDSPVKVLESGNDKINLTTPGPRWYICGVGNHCSQGMKLAVNVGNSTESESPYSHGSSSGLCARTALVLGFAAACLLVL